jgi:hypothetical protein
LLPLLVSLKLSKLNLARVLSLGSIKLFGVKKVFEKFLTPWCFQKVPNQTKMKEFLANCKSLVTNSLNNNDFIFVCGNDSTGYIKNILHDILFAEHVFD